MLLLPPIVNPPFAVINPVGDNIDGLKLPVTASAPPIVVVVPEPPILIPKALAPAPVPMLIAPLAAPPA